MIKLPPDRQWTQTNSSDVFGSLYTTYNVNFDEEGYIKPSPKSVAIYSTAIADLATADFGLPVSIFYYNGGYFVVTSGGDCFTIGARLTISEVASTPNNLGVNSDGLAWQNRAYITINTNLSYWNGSSWTNSLKSLASGVPHPLEVMGNFANGNLVIGNGNEVLRLDTSHNTVVTLTLNDDYEVQCLKYYQSNLYIGTRSVNGRDAKIFVWNGSGTIAQSEYSVSANSVFALEEYMSSVACVTSEGQILRFSGGGFSSIANFPVYSSPYRWTSEPARVQRRGLKSDGELLYINIDGKVSGSDDEVFLPNQPSGVWCYDPKVGLYCRHLSTTDPLSTINVSSRSGNTLTLASEIVAWTGEPIHVRENGSLTGVNDNTTYYIIKISDTEVQLALTPADAKAGTAITLGGTATSATVQVVGYTQYGERYSTGDIGALGVIQVDSTGPRTFPEIVTGLILWGYMDSNNDSYLNCLSIASNVGAFTTNKIWSNQVKDNFQKGFVKYADMNLSGDAIVIKTRNKDVFGLPATNVSGAFSTADILGSDDPRLSQVEQGFNINLLANAGAGQSATIENISGDEYTLTEALFVSSADPSMFNVDNFELSKVITDQSSNNKEFTIRDKSSWTQIMVELRGHVKIEEIQLVHTNNQSAK